MGDVLVAYAHRDETTNCFTQSMMQLVLYDKGRLIGSVENVRVPTGDLPVGRNAMVRHVLENNYQWLFMVDTDMGFQVSALEMLRAAAHPQDRPIVGGLCMSQRDMSRDGRNGYRWEIRPTIFDNIEFPDGIRRFRIRTEYPVNGLVQCDATGGAFVLIHRSVFERMFNEMGDVWFDRLEEPDGLMSEDISFFKRWMQINGHGSCFVHTGVKTTHVKPIWIGETDFWERLPTPPATERVDVIVPVLHRPQNVRPLLETLKASTGLATAWFVCDPGDTVEMDAVRASGGKVLQRAGTFAEKVNFAYRCIPDRTSAPWLFITGDDVLFNPGWLDQAQFVANQRFGETDAHVIGTNDLGNQRVTSGDHATHLLIRRSYVDNVGASWDGPGVVCCEAYRHWFVDDEIVNAAKQRGVWQMALGAVVEHMHPLWGKGVEDDVYALGRSFGEQDEATFKERYAKYGAVA